MLEMRIGWSVAVSGITAVIEVLWLAATESDSVLV
jgi:hypothetical protein